MIRAIWNERVVAESATTEVVEGNHYFPADSVKPEYLEASEHTSECGWKGTANYYHVVVAGERNENAAWTYREPKPEADNIAGYVAFWKGVEVCSN